MTKEYDIERTSQGFDIDEADARIKNLEAALWIAWGILEEVVIDPALYGMPISDPNHNWHDDIMEMRRLDPSWRGRA